MTTRTIALLATMALAACTAGGVAVNVAFQPPSSFLPEAVSTAETSIS